jgi:hypothetical protein
MPPALIAKLNKALNEILQEPETRDRLSKTGVIVKSSTPEAWHQFMTAEYKKWTDVRVKSGLEQSSAVAAEVVFHLRGINVRHGRACPGHPRLVWLQRKAWMPGTRPGMTAERSKANWQRC